MLFKFIGFDGYIRKFFRFDLRLIPPKYVSNDNKNKNHNNNNNDTEDRAEKNQGAHTRTGMESSLALGIGGVVWFVVFLFLIVLCVVSYAYVRDHTNDYYQCWHDILSCFHRVSVSKLHKPTPFLLPCHRCYPRPQHQHCCSCCCCCSCCHRLSFRCSFILIIIFASLSSSSSLFRFCFCRLI